MTNQIIPHIGKNVIETLTLGMYEDPRFIFREYIQNSVDQIDIASEENILDSKADGVVRVLIDKERNLVSVEDNATGVPTELVHRFLGDVANSDKDSSKRKGFRGIGRLGGLGYCEKLIFETSYKGEDVKTTMTLDARLLRKIILDKNDRSDASAVISIITSIKRTSEINASHYFKVTLENVNNEKILDIENVSKYLSMVCPLPFNPEFNFSFEIENYFKKNNVSIEEYNVSLNDLPLFKAYKNFFTTEEGRPSSLIGVDFIEIRNFEQELLALCWYGYRDYSNIVLNESSFERGIRIRHKNIAIGDESTCKRFFSAERTNLRFIGEIHTVSDSFVPNARRDYFNENNTCLTFETAAKQIFQSENLENRLAQTASNLHNRIKEIGNYKQSLDEFKLRKGNFRNEAEESYHLSKLRSLEEKAIKAKSNIEKIKSKSHQDQNIKTLFENIVGISPIDVEPLSESEKKVSRYNPPKFTKLAINEANVVLEIFQILEETLLFEESELLKKKIIERFN